MSECYFAIDKQQSLDIIQSILQTEKTPKDEYTDEEDWPLLYKHKLSVVELYLENVNKGDKIEYYYDEIISESHKGNEVGYSSSSKVDIQGIVIENEKISLDAYLFGTSAECDWSYPTFTYDENLKTWVIIDSFWNAENGIGNDGCVTILDFNSYKDN